MATTPAKKRHSAFRRGFRWFRIALLTVVLAVALVALWSNYVRVPAFITSRIKDELRRHSVAAEFARLRLKGFRRLVAEDVRLSGITTNAPSIRIGEAEILLNYASLSNGQLDISGLRVDRARLTLPLLSPEGSASELTATNIQAEIQFLPNDTLRLSGFSAEMLGAKAAASGTLTNLSRLAAPSPAPPGQEKGWQEVLSEAVQIIRQLRFAETPRLSCTFSADAADLTKARASFALHAGETASKWGAFQSVRLLTSVFPLSLNATNKAPDTVKATFQFDVDSVRTDFGTAGFLGIEAQTVWSEAMDRLITNKVAIAISNLQSGWGSTRFTRGAIASSQEAPGKPIFSTITAYSSLIETAGLGFETNSFFARLEHPLPFASPAQWLATRLAAPFVSPPTNRVPYSGEWRIDSSHVRARRTVLDGVELSGRIEPSGGPYLDQPGLSLWNSLAPFRLPWRAVVANVVTREMNMGFLQLNGDWIFPRLRIGSIESTLYGGEFSGNAELDVQTRAVTFSTRARFDYSKAALLLEDPLQKVLSYFTWTQPPLIESSASFRLPPWSGNWSDAGREIMSTLEVDGGLAGAIRFAEIPVDNVSARFKFAQSILSVPDLTLARPEGQAVISYFGNVTNQDFSCKIYSRLNPAALKELFSEEQQEAFEILKFSEPPLIEGEGRGNWNAIERIGFAGSIDATNFFVREQAFSDVKANFAFTNMIVEARNIVVHRGKEELLAPYARVDIPREVMFVTNAISTIDPWVAMSLVGDDAYDAIDPYRFAVTPTVIVNGDVPLRNPSKANIHFNVTGKEFTFWKFHLPALSADVYWRGDHLSFSNVVASFYNGTAEWSAYFLILPKSHSANYSFTGRARDADLKLLISDMVTGTNRLEGTLTADIVITSANTADYRTWNGFGSATMHDGYLWNVPVFGVFSPILDSITPGLGASRLNAGNGHYTITNSVIYTRDMQVRAPAFRLNYKGKVDFDGNLDARVEAEILRDAWIVGKLFSVALWPVAKAFEARVSGTLEEPKTKLRFFPKIVFAPIKTLNELGEAARQKQTAPANQKP